MKSRKHGSPTFYTRLFFLCIVSSISLLTSTPSAAQFPGGFVEKTDSAAIRPKLTQSQIQSFLPARGAFTFPAPYNTQGVRLTNATDCAGADCLWSVGYSYWRNTNNHVGSDVMYIFLGLDKRRGGGGPTLFSYNKVTEEVRNLGPLFDAGSSFSWLSTEGWYFSATQPTKIYVNDGPRMLRYDIFSKQFQTVFDVRTQFGADKVIWQMHSSDDDRVHSATLRNASFEMLGCVVYREDTARFQYFPKIGNFDECHVDKSGRWLMSLENVDHLQGLEMRIFDLTTGTERMVWDQDGAVGHADMGHGYVVGADNWNSLSNAQLLWDFSKDPLSGNLVSYNLSWAAAAPNHISHTNAKPGVPANQQYACGSGAAAVDAVWANEIICFRMDGAFNVLVVAPVMTDMNAASGGDSYSKQPKGNLDVTGQYFIWTSNTGGSRVDAFLVKVPAQLMTAGPDITPPSVSITSPLDGTSVSGTITVSANATDNIGVAGVQFMLDGTNLGTAATAAPYAISWNTAGSIAGIHTLTAVAWDAAGNTITSSPAMVSILGDTTAPAIDITAPAISDVVTSNISSSGATITWTTNELSDSQVEYGPTTAYGSMTALNPNLLLNHSVTLSGLAPSAVYHFRVRARNAAGNLTVSGDSTFTTANDESGPQNVVWENLINVTATGNSLKKTSGCDGCQDAGAISQQQISSGDGYLEFTVSETHLVRYVGLNNANTGTSAAEIPFAFKLVSGYAEVREKGQYLWDTPVVTGDVLRIAVKSGVVQYSKNGAAFYKSTAAPAYPLRADTSFSSANGTISNAVVATGQ